jgi:hypothetical protein
VGSKQFAFTSPYIASCVDMTGERDRHFDEEFIPMKVHDKDACSTHLGLLVLESKPWF